MLQPGKPGPEVFVAEGAFKGPVLRVEDHVLLQMRLAGEGLQTDLVTNQYNHNLLFHTFIDFTNALIHHHRRSIPGRKMVG